VLGVGLSGQVISSTSTEQPKSTPHYLALLCLFFTIKLSQRRMMEITKEEIAQKLSFHQDSSLVFINCFLGVPHTFSLLVFLPLHRSMSGLANQTKSRSHEDVPKVKKKKQKKHLTLLSL
jgi:rRNA maturation protein Rpf1